MRKQLLKFALTAIALLSSVAASAEEFVDGDWTCTVLDGGTTVSVKYNGANSAIAVTVPSIVSDGTNTYTVTALATDCFYNKTNITSVTLPSTLEEIGYCAFQNAYAVQNLDMSVCPNLTKIGDRAFEKCRAFTNITIPNTVTDMGAGAFNACTALETLTIGSGVTELNYYGAAGSGSGFCDGCSNLTTVNFAEGSRLTKIGRSAFYECSSLVNITLPNNLETIEIYAFRYCTSLTSLVIPNSVTTVGEQMINGCTNLASLTIGSGVTCLPVYSSVGFCEGLTNLSSVTIVDEENNPSQLRTIERCCFYNCPSLIELELPASVETIGDMMVTSENFRKLTIHALTAPATPSGDPFPSDRSICENIRIVVPKAAYNSYATAQYWRGMIYIYEISEGTTPMTAYSAAYIKGNANADNGYKIWREGDGLYWPVENKVQQKYSIVIEGRPYYSGATKQNYRLQVISVDDNNEETVVESFFGAFDGSLTGFQQNLFETTDALPVGSYKFKVEWLTGDMWIHKAYVTDGSDCILLKAKANPIGTSIFAASQFIGFKPFETTLKATAYIAYTGNTSWISFTNWTDGAGNEVGTEASLTKTISETTAYTANYNITRQTIPTAEGQSFEMWWNVGNNTEMDWTTDGNHGCIRSGYTTTYFINNTKPALYKVKFQTASNADEVAGSTVTVDIIDTDGNVVSTGSVEFENTGGWGYYDYRDKEITLNSPIMKGNYSVRFSFAHPNKNFINHIVNYRGVQFEKLATVPETITLNKTEATLWVDGVTEQLTTTLAPEDITEGYDGVVWTSSNTAVATVSEAGVVTAVAPGTATITATAEKSPTATAACAVTVPQHVTTITVAETAEVYAGENVTVEASVAPSNAEIKTLAWASSNEAVAIVDQNGKITGVSAGTANITVTATDRNKVSKTIAVTVKQKVTAITLNASEKTMLKSETFQLSVSAYAPENATLKEVTWTSSAPDVATVSETGLVKALAGGTATITATAKDGKGATATCAITVDVPVTSVTLDKTSQNVYINDVVVLTATVAPDDATDPTVTWSSSAPTVASVVDGTVTALTAGSAVITATSNYDETKKATFTLTVMDVQAQGEGANKLLFHNIVNTSDLTENKVAWKSDTDHSWVANSIVLTDAQPYANNADVAATSLTYNRTFSDVAWQALYVPFAMSYSDWSSVADVAYINNVHQWDKDDDGVIDLTVLEFITEKTAIEANMPYVIRPKSSGDMSIELSDATLKASPAVDGSVDCSSTRMKYILTGTYKEKEMYGTGLYALTPTGEFCYATSADAKLSPFRIYLEIQSRTASPASLPRKIVVMVDGEVQDEATSIEMINALGGSDAIFNLAGQKVSESYKGVVIKNGKKIYKK